MAHAHSVDGVMMNLKRAPEFEAWLERMKIVGADGRLAALGLRLQVVKSRAPDRETYLRRPDLGRRLAPDADISRSDHPFALVVADGLSALAVERHAVPLVEALISLAPQRWAGAGCCVALQGRVALGDDAGERLGCQLVVVLIGERPGLSS
jgi:ethanolamine ammonia-lyase small subunit